MTPFTKPLEEAINLLNVIMNMLQWKLKKKKLKKIVYEQQYAIHNWETVSSEPDI